MKITGEMIEKSVGRTYEEDWGYCEYSDITDIFGETLWGNSTGGWQGDEYVVFRGHDGRIGYLCYGYGSCSGCDALQACETLEEIVELAQDFWEGVQWFDNLREFKKWAETRDWE
jgi:hypothetical protein